MALAMHNERIFNFGFGIKKVKAHTGKSRNRRGGRDTWGKM